MFPLENKFKVGICLVLTSLLNGSSNTVVIILEPIMLSRGNSSDEVLIAGILYLVITIPFPFLFGYWIDHTVHRNCNNHGRLVRNRSSANTSDQRCNPIMAVLSTYHLLRHRWRCSYNLVLVHFQSLVTRTRCRHDKYRLFLVAHSGDLGADACVSHLVNRYCRRRVFVSVSRMHRFTACIVSVQNVIYHVWI